MRKIAVQRKSGCCKPRDRRLRDAVGAGQFCLCFAIGKAPESFCPLMWGEHIWPSKSHSAGLGAGSAFASASTNQLSLELGQATENREHQPAMRRCGVCPCVPETEEAGFTLADGCQYIEQVAG